MPTTNTTTPSYRRETQNMIRSLGAALSGRPRGRDRQVRRNSFDVDDRRAQPWARILDGSKAQGLAHREAIIEVAREHAVQDQLLQTRFKAAVKEAAGGAMHARAQAVLVAHRAQAVRRIDVAILDGLLRFVDFRSGRCDPSLMSIAKRAGVSIRSVIYGLRRLQARGFLDWVRRSVSTGAEGSFGRQREQATNAYFFEHRGMGERILQRLAQLLDRKLRRIEASAPVVPPDPPVARPRGPSPALAAALRSLEARVLAQASHASA